AVFRSVRRRDGEREPVAFLVPVVFGDFGNRRLFTGHKIADDQIRAWILPLGADRTSTSRPRTLRTTGRTPRTPGTRTPGTSRTSSTRSTGSDALVVGHPRG